MADPDLGDVQTSPAAALAASPADGETVRTRTLRELHELIAALDRRVPQVQRAGEVSIATAAAALRTEALVRIEELAREAGAKADRVEVC